MSKNGSPSRLGRLKAWQSASSLLDEDPILLAKPEDLERTQSLGDLLEADEGTGDKRDGSPKEGDITRKHWRKSRDHPTCMGCDKTFSLSRRKGHCRKCGQVVCQSCARYKLPLNENAEYDPSTGALHKVCYRCAREQEGALMLGQTRSLTEDFRFEKKQSCIKPIREENDLNSLPRHHLPEKYVKLLQKFNADLQDDRGNRVQARVQNAIERARLATRCATAECKRQMLLPQDRKLCVACEDVFCRECSAKDVVVFRPHDDPECDARVSIAQTVTVTAQVPGNKRAYRACDTCREQLHQHCRSYYFHRDLELCQAQLLDLQTQISPALDRAVTDTDKKRVTQLPRSSSMGDLLEDSSEHDHTVKDIDRRILEKLFEQYFRMLSQLTNLKPVTSAQQKLHQAVAQGTGSFYTVKRSLFRLQLGW